MEANFEVLTQIDAALVTSEMARPLSSKSSICAGDIVDSLERHGVKSYISGGAVRNWLLGKPARDIDISIDRSIADAISPILTLSNDLTVEINDDFGLAFVIGDLGVVDISIMRSCDDVGDNIETAIFSPQTSIVPDSYFRDFTINSFYLDYNPMKIWNIFPDAMSHLESSIIDLTMDVRKVAVDYRTSIRIIQFLARGYTPTNRTIEALKAHLDAHVCNHDQFGEWILHYVPEGSRDFTRFREVAMTHCSTELARSKLQHFFESSRLDRVHDVTGQGD